MIWVSAVVPVFNAEKTLERAVNSLLIQSEIDEIVLVEDGSNDGSFRLCKKLESKHSIIKVHTHPNRENRGAPASRNLGLKQVKNDWIQFMDSDDELLPGKIADQTNRIEGTESFVISPFTISRKGKESVYFPNRDHWSGLISTRLGNTVSNLFNKHVISQVGGWNESLKNVQEYYLMFDMLKVNENIAYTDTSLTRIFPQPNSITNSNAHLDKKRNNYFVFRALVKNYLQENGAYTIRRKHHYNVCTGENLKYHKPVVKFSWNPVYYFLYKSFKRIIR